MAKKLDHPEARICAYSGCKIEFSIDIPNKRFCCDAHRAKASHDAKWVPRKVTKSTSYTGPMCWCGMPGSFDGKCGRHNFARRYANRKRKELLTKLTGHMTNEQLREVLAAGGFQIGVPHRIDGASHQQSSVGLPLSLCYRPIGDRDPEFC